MWWWWWGNPFVIYSWCFLFLVVGGRGKVLSGVEWEERGLYIITLPSPTGIYGEKVYVLRQRFFPFVCWNEKWVTKRSKGKIFKDEIQLKQDDFVPRVAS